MRGSLKVYRYERDPIRFESAMSDVIKELNHQRLRGLYIHRHKGKALRGHRFFEYRAPTKRK